MRSSAQPTARVPGGGFPASWRQFSGALAISSDGNHIEVWRDLSEETMRPRFLACTLAFSMTAFLPALAAADGVPSLTPQGNDTTYDFTMPGSSSSMDPALSGGAFTWRGTLLLQQDQDASNFNGTMSVDTNGDGSP